MAKIQHSNNNFRILLQASINRPLLNADKSYIYYIDQ